MEAFVQSRSIEANVFEALKTLQKSVQALSSIEKFSNHGSFILNIQTSRQRLHYEALH
jgi:hypothetical protein